MGLLEDDLIIPERLKSRIICSDEIEEILVFRFKMLIYFNNRSLANLRSHKINVTLTVSEVLHNYSFCQWLSQEHNADKSWD